MGYRWAPNAAQKAEYCRKMRERETLPIQTTTKAIRNGCIVEFYSTNLGSIVEGKVVNSSYGTEKGQHTFTIETPTGKILVKGRNLYPNIIKHIQGELSIIESK